MWTPLKQQCRTGDRVGILGLGGLGSMALTFAKALGYEVTALSSTTSKRDEALASGAAWNSTTESTAPSRPRRDRCGSFLDECSRPPLDAPA